MEGEFGLKKHSNFVPHSRITVYMKAFSIDSWDKNEYFRVDADGKNIINERFHHTKGKNICGNGHKDRVLPITRSFAHSRSALTLKIYATLN